MSDSLPLDRHEKEQNIQNIYREREGEREREEKEGEGGRVREGERERERGRGRGRAAHGRSMNLSSLICFTILTLQAAL